MADLAAQPQRLRAEAVPLRLPSSIYGLYGIPEKATLSKARFIFFRDSVSLARARADGVRAPIMEWGEGMEPG